MTLADPRHTRAMLAFLDEVLTGQPNARTYKRDADGRFGSGGGTPESEAAEKLNAGELLGGETDTEERIASAIDAWAGGGQELGQLQREMRDETKRPGQDTDGALLFRTIAAAPPTGPVLHRGMVHVDPADVPVAGGTLKLGPTSFSSSSAQADDYTVHRTAEDGLPTSMRLTLRAGSRSLNIEDQANTEYSSDREHIGMGEYKVINSTSRQTTITTRDGEPRAITMYDVEIEQI